MQTFLPYQTFGESVSCLDNRRLGKQRVEAYQILLALGDPWALSVRNKERPLQNGWKNHPATLMWKGHEEALKFYMGCCIVEWVSRGFKNTMPLAPIDYEKLVMPKIIGNYQFHASHRAALLFKDIYWYSQFGWYDEEELEPKIDYMWKLND